MPVIYSPHTKQKTIELRKQGYSINEIYKIMGIAKGTASVWLRGIKVSNKGIERLHSKENESHKLLKKYYQGKYRNFLNKIKAEEYKLEIVIENNINDKYFYKFICVLLYWAEGSKDLNTVSFVNSNPAMIKLFLTAFKKGYDVDMAKLHVLMHLHEYHNEKMMKLYWSRITQIPQTQFYRTFIKPHTGKNKKPGYKGCISIRYCDTTIAREINYLYNAIAKTIVEF